MHSDEMTYLRRRAAQHRAGAKRAATPAVAAIHAVLAETYLEALIAKGEARERDYPRAA